MKKGKFFCKLLGMAFATFTAFSGLLVNNCTYAFPANTIIENALKNKPYSYEFNPEEIWVMENLGIKRYEDFLEKILKEPYVESFVDKYRGDEEKLDSVYFLFFLRFVSSRCAKLGKGNLVEDVIRKMIFDRTTVENRSDKYLAKCFDNFFGTNFKILLTCCSSRTLRNLRS